VPSFNHPKQSAKKPHDDKNSSKTNNSIHKNILTSESIAAALANPAKNRHAIMQLQRAYGNRAVQRMIVQRAPMKTPFPMTPAPKVDFSKLQGIVDQSMALDDDNDDDEKAPDATEGKDNETVTDPDSLPDLPDIIGEQLVAMGGEEVPETPADPKPADGTPVEGLSGAESRKDQAKSPDTVMSANAVRSAATGSVEAGKTLSDVKGSTAKITDGRRLAKGGGVQEYKTGFRERIKILSGTAESTANASEEKLKKATEADEGEVKNAVLNKLGLEEKATDFLEFMKEAGNYIKEAATTFVAPLASLGLAAKSVKDRKQTRDEFEKVKKSAKNGELKEIATYALGKVRRSYYTKIFEFVSAIASVASKLITIFGGPAAVGGVVMGAVNTLAGAAKTATQKVKGFWKWLNNRRGANRAKNSEALIRLAVEKKDPEAIDLLFAISGETMLAMLTREGISGKKQLATEKIKRLNRGAVPKDHNGEPYTGDHIKKGLIDTPEAKLHLIMASLKMDTSETQNMVKEQMKST